MNHDVVCSWCHIGYQNINRALERLSNEVSAEIHYLPFRLNPDMGTLGVDITKHLCQRNQWSIAEVMAYWKSWFAAQDSPGLIAFSPYQPLYLMAADL